MSDQNNREGYNDFFNGAGGSGERNDTSREPEAGASAPRAEHREGDASASESLRLSEDARPSEPAKPSYYYSYGPFKSGTPSAEDAEPASPAAAYPPPRGERRPDAAEPVEITAPRPVPGYDPSLPAQSAAARGNWQFKKEPPKRSSFRAMFASFLAGVIVVGGLMFSSDYFNWFSASPALAPQAAGSAATASASGSGNGVVSNALDVVRPNNIATIFQQSSPAVVKIETYVRQSTNSGGGSGGFFDDDPFFRQFFGDDGTGGQRQQQQPDNSTGELTPSGLGSGFLFEKDGYILTNQHVVANSDKVTVTVQGYDKPFDAKVLGQSYDLDLAVVKIEGEGFPTLALGDSDKIAVGEWVVAIGNPNGFDHTVTVGVLSAKERPITIPDTQGDRNYQHLLQTDASINPGNSGGPLINLEGEVIGINTAVSTQSQGIGFAIPSSTIKSVVENLKANKEIPKTPVPFIGATLHDISADDAAQLGVNGTDGAYVYDVLYKSPAYNADLRKYDVIVGLDGTKYKTKEEMIAAIQKKKVGDTIALNVIRNGRAVNLTVTIGDKNKFQTQQ